MVSIVYDKTLVRARTFTPLCIAHKKKHGAACNKYIIKKHSVAHNKYAINNCGLARNTVFGAPPHYAFFFAYFYLQHIVQAFLFFQSKIAFSES